MSPKQIAEKLITIHPKSLTKPEDNIFCLIYRPGYKPGIQKTGSEGFYGVKHEVEFFLHTQQHFLKEVIEEVINDCIDAVYEAKPSDDDMKEACVSAIRKRFSENANESSL